nr:hypothetical protein [Pseudonocardia sp. ICBG601]
MTAGVPAVRRVVEPHPGAAAALGDLWIAVTEAGGAVDFVPGADPDEIRALAVQTVDAVRSGASRMFVLGRRPPRWARSSWSRTPASPRTAPTCNASWSARTCRDVVSARSCSERPSPTPVRRAWRC